MVLSVLMESGVIREKDSEIGRAKAKSERSFILYCLSLRF